MAEHLEWLDGIRGGWKVTAHRDSEGRFWGVRHCDGRTVEGTTTERVMGLMVAADVKRSWRKAGMH